MTKKVRVAPNLAIAGPFRSGAARNAAAAAPRMRGGLPPTAPSALPHARARVAEIPGARGKVPRSFS